METNVGIASSERADTRMRSYALHSAASLHGAVCEAKQPTLRNQIIEVVPMAPPLLPPATASALLPLLLVATSQMRLRRPRNSLAGWQVRRAAETRRAVGPPAAASMQRLGRFC